MPVYKGQEFIERVEKGQEEIKRSCKGGDLTYGLYDLNYHDRNQIYIPKSNEIDRYAWGKNRYLPPAQGNTDFNDYSADPLHPNINYPTHWYNWYKDKIYQNECDKWSNNRPYIKYTDKENFDLYAKWAQKQFSYSGTVGYDEKTGGGSFTPIPNGSYTYQDLWSAGYCDFKGIESSGYKYQCTWVAAGRLKALGSSNTTIGTGSYWFITSGLPTGQTPYPGAMACWFTDDKINQHNAIVERVENGVPIFSHGNYGGTDLNPVNNICVTSYFPTSPPFKGYAYTDVTDYGGGGETWEHKTIDVPSTECSDQNDPKTPSAKDIAAEHDIYEDDYHKNIDWDTGPNEKTEKREWNYIASSSGDWGSWIDDGTGRYNLDW